MRVGGWIKMEKDLLTDPRVLSLTGNGGPFQSVTVLLGCLAHLWMIADAHVGEDDILSMGTNKIDQVLGTQGFCQAMPQDWLQVIDSNHVKLPGFYAHNGPQAKERAQNQKRVAAHREKRNATPLPPRNGPPLPDKTRLDQTLKESSVSPSATKPQRLPGEWQPTPELKTFATDLGLDPQRIAADFRDYWHAIPGGRGVKLDWPATWRRWCRKALDTEPARPNGHAPGAQRDVAAWSEARNLAKQIGFREPWPQESVGAYATAVKLARDRPPALTLAQLQARAHR